MLQQLAADKAALREFLAAHQTQDVILQYPAPLSAQQLVDSLRRQQPRLYSIASSQAEVGEEVHLTVGVVRYDAFLASPIWVVRPVSWPIDWPKAANCGCLLNTMITSGCQPMTPP